jgi:hypothetical protein
MSLPFEIDRTEASYWWRTNVIAGVILHRLMWLFIAASAALVWQGYQVLGFLVVLGMIPYGFFLRFLSARACSNFLEEHPESVREFENSGIITR